jgi:glycosyltransferase involved in cell wall biosynthesis
MSDSDALHFQSGEAMSEASRLEQTEWQLRQTRFQLQQRCTELEQRCIELEHCEARLAQTQKELGTSQANLATIQSLRSALEETQSRLRQRNDKLKEVRAKLKNRNADVQHIYEMVLELERSKFWKLRKLWGKVRSSIGLGQPLQSASEAIALLLPGSPEAAVSSTSSDSQTSEQKLDNPEKIAGKPGRKPASQGDRKAAYQSWVAQHTPTPSDLEHMAYVATLFPQKPRFSIILPTYNTPESFLREAIQSVLDQVYPHWELCIADDASTKSHVRSVLDGFARQDERIKVVYRSENGHISQASNSALELATGDFIALLDHDDRLAPEALYEVAYVLNQHPDADMVYTDEDFLDEDGERCNPHFKPDWCPDSFLSRMYTCHLGVYRRELVSQIGGFRPSFEGSQDYDLVLRFTEHTNRIYHIPKVLYHWRIHELSVTGTAEAKPYAYIAAEKAITEALERRGEPGQVRGIEDYPGFYTIRYQIQRPGKVSIIIPTRNLGKLLNQCLASVFSKTAYANYEVIVVDNGSDEPATLEILEQWQTKEPERFRCLPYDIPFNFAQLNNYAVAQTDGEYLLFLNNDTEIITPDWLEALVEQAQRPSVGAVGALLLYDDDTVQHAGVTIGVGPAAGHSHRHFPKDSPGYFGTLLATSNFSAVTGACLMCRRGVFEAVGGFEEDLAVALNDVDLCLKIQEQGWRNVYVPHARLYHYESKSRGYDDAPEKRARYQKEAEYFKRRWQHVVDHDPCYSINLTRDREDFSIRLGGAVEELVQDLTRKLRQTRNQANRLETQLEQTRSEMGDLQGRIAAMETSKFWQLRSRWIKLKQSLGLKE